MLTILRSATIVSPLFLASRAFFNVAVPDSPRVAEAMSVKWYSTMDDFQGTSGSIGVLLIPAQPNYKCLEGDSGWGLRQGGVDGFAVVKKNDSQNQTESNEGYMNFTPMKPGCVRYNNDSSPGMTDLLHLVYIRCVHTSESLRHIPPWTEEIEHNWIEIFPVLLASSRRMG